MTADRESLAAETNAPVSAVPAEYAARLHRRSLFLSVAIVRFATVVRSIWKPDALPPMICRELWRPD
jgi:hypothetical protein